ncbi:MAG: MFS transporter [Thermoplasmataceae archaeon]
MARFLNGFGRFPLYTLLTLYYYEIFHLPYIYIGLIFTLSAVFSIPASLYGGYISDKVGRRAMIIFSCLMVFFSAILLFIMALTSFPMIPFIAVSMLISLGSSLQRPALNSAVTDLSTSEQRVSAFSINRITSNAGIGVGLIVVGIVWAFGPSLFFIVTAAGTAIELLLYILYVPETYKRSLDNLNIKRHLYSRSRLLLLVSFFLSGSMLFSQQWLTSVFPLYMTRYDGFSVLEITILYSLNTLVVVLLQGSASRIISALGEIKAFALGTVLFAIGYTLFGFLSIFYEVVAIVLMISFGENLTIIIPQLIVSKISPHDRRGEYFGTNSAISSLFFSISPLIGTFLLSLFLYEPQMTWYIIATLSIAILIFTPLVSREIKKTQAVINS